MHTIAVRTDQPILHTINHKKQRVLGRRLPLICSLNQLNIRRMRRIETRKVPCEQGGRKTGARA
jgi:hypothetical protein